MRYDHQLQPHLSYKYMNQGCIFFCNFSLAHTRLFSSSKILKCSWKNIWLDIEDLKNMSCCWWWWWWNKFVNVGLFFSLLASIHYSTMFLSSLSSLLFLLHIVHVEKLCTINTHTWANKHDSLIHSWCIFLYCFICTEHQERANQTESVLSLLSVNDVKIFKRYVR